jgi:GNAT superfamily N-acetyltransferase
MMVAEFCAPLGHVPRESSSVEVRPGAATDAEAVCTLAGQLAQSFPSRRTFYANGPVAWVEEVLVEPQFRTQGAGRALMQTFEDWAVHRGCAVAALATRRAAPFYVALGYEESASYLRKVLPSPGLPSGRPV